MNTAAHVRTLFLAMTAASVCGGLPAAQAAGAAVRGPQLACTALVGREFYNVAITAAQDVPASGAAAGRGAGRQ